MVVHAAAAHELAQPRIGVCDCFEWFQRRVPMCQVIVPYLAQPDRHVAELGVRARAAERARAAPRRNRHEQPLTRDLACDWHLEHLER